MPWDISYEPRDFSTAEMLFRDQLGLSEEEFEEILDQARGRAFNVAGVTDLQLIDQIFDEVSKAEKEGTDFRDFADEFGPRLAEQWGGEDPGRLQTIFRTNVLGGYSLGRFGQMTDPDVLKARPYWRFVCIDPCEICLPCEDTVLPADDSWWNDHYPLLHHQCECTVMSLTEEEAKEYGIDDEGPKSDPDEGFGGTPDLSDWDPDLSGYPDELKEIYESKQKKDED